jgi:hypothetical protein
MLARIDEAGLPCYLETLEERNVRIYEHFGFTVAEESAIPETNLTNWAMLRKVRFFQSNDASCLLPEGR